MKIIISERQKKLISENISEENLRKLCYQIWDKQKKMGQEPHLDDIIYDVTGIGKNTTDDFDIIRPIWYEYNGGFDNLMEKIKNEIIGKTYILSEPTPGIETKFRIKEVNLEQQDQWPNQIIEVICEVDINGMIDYEMYDDEEGQVFLKRDTIEQAMYDLEYEQEDLLNYLRGLTYDVLEPIINEKYGSPFNIEIE
jgi:hypothetical protein